jgi:putative NIF3 family GTP cyclohydrolase 1 type 2
MSLHEKKASCRAAHAAAMTAFKEKQVAAKAAAVPAEDPAPPAGSSVAALWEECKKNKDMAATVAKIEKKVTEMSEDFDDDPCFRPEEGFKEAICNAIGYARQVDEAKQKMDELVIKHDEEIGNLTWTVREQGKRIQLLETVKTNLSIEVSTLRDQIAAMQKEFDAYKKAHP